MLLVYFQHFSIYCFVKKSVIIIANYSGHLEPATNSGLPQSNNDNREQKYKAWLGSEQIKGNKSVCSEEN